MILKTAAAVTSSEASVGVVFIAVLGPSFLMSFRDSRDGRGTYIQLPFPQRTAMLDSSSSNPSKMAVMHQGS